LIHDAIGRGLHPLAMMMMMMKPAPGGEIVMIRVSIDDPACNGWPVQFPTHNPMARFLIETYAKQQ
jgi:hypothetical protein